MMTPLPLNAEAVLIIWGICLVVVIVIVLAEAIRGDEQTRADNTRPTDECGAFDPTALSGLPGLAGLKARNSGKGTFLIEATDMTKNHNKEGTDGETELRED